MNLTDLNERSPKYRARRRVGRGHASGLGKTSGRGQKGAKSRSGFTHKPGFEGGQMPMYRRFPKRGFSNARFRVDYDIVNVEKLNALDEGTTVTHDVLAKAGLIRKKHGRLKVLGGGKLTVKLIVHANKFTASARSQIEGAGGEAKEI